MTISKETHDWLLSNRRHGCETLDEIKALDEIERLQALVDTLYNVVNEANTIALNETRYIEATEETEQAWTKVCQLLGLKSWCEDE